MLHRVILGSLERFCGALLEHYNGQLPLWLSPVQVVVIPIKDAQGNYGQKVKKALLDNFIRAELDNRNETLDKRIREAEVNKIPYCLILGQREEKNETVSVRKKGEGDKGSRKLEEFIKEIKEAVGCKL